MGQPLFLISNNQKNGSLSVGCHWASHTVFGPSPLPNLKELGRLEAPSKMYRWQQISKEIGV